MYDYLIITHLPSFYKVNLYNGLVDSGLKIKVLFVGISSTDRERDFIKTAEDIKFNYTYLSLGNFNKCNNISRIAIEITIRFIKQISVNKHRLLLVSGWDLIPYWLAVFLFSRKRKNCLALESTIYNSKSAGWEGFIKKIFLKRIQYVFSSGEMHIELLKRLHYTGNYFITKGVGLINRPNINAVIKKEDPNKVKFLFVGRLVKEKNLLFLCKVFKYLIEEKSLPITLTMVGKGPLSQELEKYLNDKIQLIDYIPNKSLDIYYQSNDVFILPSISETWGLVIEEAIYHKLPILISNRCGARELIQDGMNGLWFDPLNENDLKEKIRLIIPQAVRLQMVAKISKMDLNEKDAQQIMTYHHPLVENDAKMRTISPISVSHHP